MSEAVELPEELFLPDLGQQVRTGTTARVVRDYIRDVMIPDIVKRQFKLAMGLTRHAVPVAVPGMKDHPPHVEIVYVEAPAAVQHQAMKALMDKAVPSYNGPEGGVLAGVIVLPGLDGLDEARRRAQMHRMEEVGFSIGGGGPPNLLAQPEVGSYVPPPGHKVVVIENDLSSPGSSPPDDAAPPPTKKRLTKAQQIAQRRKARRP